MTPRDVIARDLRTTYAFGSIDTNARADLVISALTAAGFSIVKTEELVRVRDDALEEAASEAASWQETANKLAKTPSQKDRADLHMVAADMARDVALAIRALKGAKPHRTTTAAEADPDGAFERAYAEVAGRAALEERGDG